MADTRSEPIEHLTVTEIFYSIQGEGSRAGRPCTMIRLTGCDLRCRWCDTAYAFSGGRRMSIQEVVSEIDRIGCTLVEVTGGEPLLQAGVHELMRRLLESGREVLLETGGQRDLSSVDPRVIRIMDIKAPGSGEAEKNLWRNLEYLTVRDEVKIVIADRRDYEWARDVVRTRGLAHKLTVLFSPVHGELALDELAAWILEDRLPVRLQTQLHKLVWGAEARGV